MVGLYGFAGGGGGGTTSCVSTGSMEGGGGGGAATCVPDSTGVAGGGGGFNLAAAIFCAFSWARRILSAHPSGAVWVVGAREACTTAGVDTVTESNGGDEAEGLSMGGGANLGLGTADGFDGSDEGFESTTGASGAAGSGADFLLLSARRCAKASSAVCATGTGGATGALGRGDEVEGASVDC